MTLKKKISIAVVALAGLVIVLLAVHMIVNGLDFQALFKSMHGGGVGGRSPA